MAKSELGQQGNFFKRHSREALFVSAGLLSAAGVGLGAASAIRVSELNAQQASLRTLPYEGQGSATELKINKLAGEQLLHVIITPAVEIVLFATAGVAAGKALKKPQEA